MSASVDARHLKSLLREMDGATHVEVRRSMVIPHIWCLDITKDGTTLIRSIVIPEDDDVSLSPPG